MAKPGLRQLGKPTKNQLAGIYARQIISQLTDLASGIRDMVEKGRGIDPKTRMVKDIGCPPAEIFKHLNPAQADSMRKFVADWASEEPAPPKSNKKGK